MTVSEAEIIRFSDRATGGVAVSIVTPTIGRTSLSRAVASALSQRREGVRLEVIVVNDSGRPLAHECWMNAPEVRLIHTGRSERSVARNAGASIARGEYLLFLDDDDYLLPGAIDALLEVARATSSRRVFGAYRLADQSGAPIKDLYPEAQGDMLALFMAGESIPLGASLIERSLFFAAGAFNPCYTALEDYDLVVRLALRSPIEATDHLVACFRVGEAGGTTDWAWLPAQLRHMREAHLDMPQLLDRARASAGRNWQLRGRLVRVYLSSAVWNLRPDVVNGARRVGNVVRRLAGAARLSIPAFVVPAFWRGLRRPGMRPESPQISNHVTTDAHRPLA